MPLLPAPSNNTITWTAAIKNWTTDICQESKHLILGFFWMSWAIMTIGALNIISTQVASNEHLNFEKLFITLIKWAVISNSTVSFFVSFLKKRLTIFGSQQLEKTLFYKVWNKLKNKVFSSPILSTTTNSNFEEIKNKINIIEANKIELTEKIKEFWKLQQPLATTFETLFHKNGKNNIIVTLEQESNTEENSNNSSTICSLIINELINVIATTIVLTCGVAFSTTINIVKNSIANELYLDSTIFIETFTAFDTIIVSFLAIIIFKLKFNLIENGLENFKELLLWQWIKKMNKKTRYFSNGNWLRI